MEVAMKKPFPLLALALTLLMVLIASCQPQPTPPAAGLPQTPQPFLTPGAPGPTGVCPITVTPPAIQPTVPPTVVQPTVCPSATEGPVCDKHGDVAWHLENLAFDQEYGEFTFGDQECWITGQIWTQDPFARWIFALPPGMRLTIRDFRGGTAWFLSAEIANIGAQLNNQARELEARQPGVPTFIIILPGDRDKFPIVVSLD
jgi:hypothetical protein